MAIPETKVPQKIPKVLKNLLNLAKNAVDDPVGGRGAHTVAVAKPLSQQMIRDAPQDGILHVGRIFHANMLLALLVDDMNREIIEDREGNLSAVANDEYAVFPRTFVSHETPSAGSRHSAVKLHGGRHGVFRVIKSAAIRREAIRFYDGAEEMLKEVELMRRKVVEIATARNVRLQSPGQISLVVVHFSRRRGKSYLCRQDIAHHSRLKELLDALEIRQEPTIVSHEARQVVGRRHAVDAYAVIVVRGQRLLNIYRLTRIESHDGISGMSRRRSGYIDGINIRVGDEILRVVIPSANAMPLRKGFGTLNVSAHHRHDFSVREQREGRERAAFGGLATTDKAPTDNLISKHRSIGERSISEREK